MSIEHKIENAKKIIGEARSEFKPRAIYCGFSGGTDSLVCTHIAMNAGADGVVHINTGIGIEETRQFVRDTCEKYNWPLIEVRALEDAGQDYEALVLEWGFPGPKHHKKMMNRLKGRALRWLKRQIKVEWQDKFVILTGVRQQESRIRMGYKKYLSEDELWCWANPLFYWSKKECREYVRLHDLEENPVSKLLGMSGECLCGAYASKGELEMICQFFPETGAKIKELEERVRAAGHPWGWDDPYPYWMKDIENGQTTMFGFDEMTAPAECSQLCNNCDVRHHKANKTDGSAEFDEWEQRVLFSMESPNE